jgi:Methane oxygenase PmoA
MMKKVIAIMAVCFFFLNSQAQKVILQDAGGKLTFRSAGKELLSYQYKTVYPPAGIDTSYKRSGFIHPIYAPHGQVLTRIQAPDHYHHYGIWHAWTHTFFQGDTVDFWNLKKQQGTIRFVKFISKSNGSKFAAYTAQQQHIVFKKDGSEEVALNEWQTVRVHNPEKETGNYIVDITSTMKCASKDALLIVAYRYAGFGWRATEYWDKNNSEMLSSEGKTRDNADFTNARWLIVYGALPGNDEGGMVLLSHPSNYNHPEPLRIWDKTQNAGRGDVFVNFAPTKTKNWLLEPGKTYTLKYRLVVFNGTMTKEKAETAWQSFAMPVLKTQ